MDEVSILEGLADGINPFTGEVLPDEHLLQHPRIVRALFHAIRAIEREGHQVKQGRSLPANAGSAWTKEEEQRLIERFDANTSVTEIALLHGRSKGAIASRLVHLGKLSAREEAE